jgi:hypothetical protein
MMVFLQDDSVPPGVACGSLWECVGRTGWRARPRRTKSCRGDSPSKPNWSSHVVRLDDERIDDPHKIHTTEVILNISRVEFHSEGSFSKFKNSLAIGCGSSSEKRDRDIPSHLPLALCHMSHFDSSRAADFADQQSMGTPSRGRRVFVRAITSFDSIFRQGGWRHSP